MASGLLPRFAVLARGGTVISGLYTAASGMVALQTKLDVLANNLANADTPGFKADLLTMEASATPPAALSSFPPLVVQTPQGERYTRAGNFTRDAEGFLATPGGFRVLGTRGPVRVPDTGFRVAEDGSMAGGERLRIVEGPGGGALVKAGANLFAPREAGAPPADAEGARVIQAHLESSNVNSIMTMVEMLSTMRAYEAYQKTIQGVEQAAGQAANEVGRP
jgi:flagellar basal-body rod protein FlgG